MEEETNDTNNMKITIEEEDVDLEDDTDQMEGHKRKRCILKCFLLDQTSRQDANVRNVDLST